MTRCILEDGISVASQATRILRITWNAKIGIVEQVIGFHSNVNLYVFSNREIFVQRSVKLRECRPAQNIAPGRTNGTNRWRWTENGRVSGRLRSLDHDSKRLYRHLGFCTGTPASHLTRKAIEVDVWLRPRPAAVSSEYNEPPRYSYLPQRRFEFIWRVFYWSRDDN